MTTMSLPARRLAPLFCLLAQFCLLALAACGREAPTTDQAAVDAASGAWKTCAACHGAEAGGNAALNAPALVNLDPDYLARQLEHFATGKRGADARDSFGQIMATQAGNAASEEQIDALIQQIDAFPDIKPATTLAGDIASGRDHYNMVCGACHGPEAVGNPLLNAPSLRGIDDWYLQRQYENFRAGIRGSHPDDLFGRQMQRMGQVLETEADVRDVASYLASLDVDG